MIVVRLAPQARLRRDLCFDDALYTAGRGRPPHAHRPQRTCLLVVQPHTTAIIAAFAYSPNLSRLLSGVDRPHVSWAASKTEMVDLRSATKYVFARHHQAAQSHASGGATIPESLVEAHLPAPALCSGTTAGLLAYAPIRPGGKISTPMIVSGRLEVTSPGAVATLQCQLSYTAWLFPENNPRNPKVCSNASDWHSSCCDEKRSGSFQPLRRWISAR